MVDEGFESGAVLFEKVVIIVMIGRNDDKRGNVEFVETRLEFVSGVASRLIVVECDVDAGFSLH